MCPRSMAKQFQFSKKYFSASPFHYSTAERLEKAPKARFLGNLNNLLPDIQAAISFRRAANTLAEAPDPVFLYLERTSLAIQS